MKKSKKIKLTDKEIHAATREELIAHWNSVINSKDFDKYEIYLEYIRDWISLKR